VRLGGYRRDTLIDKKLFLASTVDLEMRFEGASDDALVSFDPVTIDPHLGVEFSLYDRFFTRIGLDRNDFTAGAGLKIARFTLDYAFVAASSDYVHRVGLTVDFDPRLPPGVQRD